MFDVFVVFVMMLFLLLFVDCVVCFEVIVDMFMCEFDVLCV